MAHFLRSTLLASVTALSTVFASLPAHALDEQQKKEMGEFIKQYLIENPEIMLEVQDALERKQYATRNAKAAEAVADNKKAIFESKFDLALGNPDGDVTLVEFFDYNCGYCKRAMADMDKILKGDKKVRVVLKEFDSGTGIGRRAPRFQRRQTACSGQVPRVPAHPARWPRTGE